MIAKILGGALLLVSCLASAEVVTSFDTNNYIACSSRGQIAVIQAKEAQDKGWPVESILNEHYNNAPNPRDVRLAVLASDALRVFKPADVKNMADLAGFLAGVCYQSFAGDQK